MSESPVDVYYLSLPVESTDQANSLAAYLNAHGVTAEGITDEVTCPLPQEGLTGTSRVLLIRQLHKTWRLFWSNSDSELYGLPVYVKASATECHQGCTTP